MSVGKFCTAALLLVVVVVGVCHVNAAAPELPPYLKRCSRNTTRSSWNGCLKLAIEDGFAKLKSGDESINIEPFDPLTIDQIIISKAGSLISLDVNQKNARVRGFGEGIKLDKVDFNLDKKFFSASLLIPRLFLESYQVLKGKILGIPLTWKGDMSCNITRVKCNFNAPFRPIVLDGKEHLKFSESDVKLHLDVEHVHVHHKESSPNEKIIATAADTIINSNWRLVFGVMKPSYEDIFRKQLGKSLRGVFTSVPTDGIFL